MIYENAELTKTTKAKAKATVQTSVELKMDRQCNRWKILAARCESFNYTHICAEN